MAAAVVADSAGATWREPGIQERLRCFFESLGSDTGCRHEDWRLQQGSSAFPGLHSNWVTEEILACARPTERLLDEGLADAFREAGISSIINLEEIGEHPWCGPGITESGFSYRPQRFADAGVAFHHLPWEDMGCPTFSTMFSIVEIIKEATSSGGKVAIHCHAGLGRTGLVAACYLVHSAGMAPDEPVSLTVRAHDLLPDLVHSVVMAPDEAVALVRQKRSGSVQTTRQANYVSSFQVFLTQPAVGEGDRAPLLLDGASPAPLIAIPAAVTSTVSLISQSCWDGVIYLVTCCCPGTRTEHTKLGGGGSNGSNGGP